MVVIDGEIADGGGDFTVVSDLDVESVMCQDSAIWWAMWDAGTFCPVEGKVGVEAKNYWLDNTALIPTRPKIK